MRVAYLLTSVSAGGATKSFLLLLKALQNTQIQTFVYYPTAIDQFLLDQISSFANGIKQVDIATINCNQAYITDKKKAKSIISQDYSWFVADLLSNEIDILHVNTTIYPHIVSLVKERSNIKVITHVRELLNSSIKYLYSYHIAQICKSDYLIFISDNEKAHFPCNKNYLVLPNPFDFSEINNFGSSYNLNKKTDTIYIGMMGAFTKSKGQLLFLKIANSILRSTKRKVKFVLIGYPSKNKSLLIRIAKLLLLRPDYKDLFDFYYWYKGLKESVILVKTLSNPLLLINEIDIYLRPSLSMDPWGRDIIENMAVGNAVIATGVSSFYIQNNFNGLLVSSTKVDRISEKLMHLIDNEQDRIEFGVRASNMIREKCSMDSYRERILEIYQKLMI